MKKLFGLVMLVLMFASCRMSSETKSNLMFSQQNADMFIEIDVPAYCTYRVVYDKETLVMYTVSDGAYNHGAFTMLVNADGTPKLYKK